ncbi:MAG: hypothetical protein IIA09_18510 [Proteobacteria bacterium]|nr:hypothetical protein [Pseudomonadota bacterium]
MSILAGIGNLVDDWLKIEPKGQPPFYRHRLAAIDAGYSNPSKENWRWKGHLELSPENKSPELRLERSIVRNCGENWSNQMPTASGLVGPAADKRAAVDLVYREDSTAYSLIELKVNSDNPLFAAIEILMCGLLFVWSRNNQEKLDYDVQIQPGLAADNVTLSVLAPISYYRDFDLSIVASALNIGLPEFGKQHNVTLGFEFWELRKGCAPDSSSETIELAISDRSRI